MEYLHNTAIIALSLVAIGVMVVVCLRVIWHADPRKIPSRHRAYVKHEVDLSTESRRDWVARMQKPECKHIGCKHNHRELCEGELSCEFEGGEG